MKRVVLFGATGYTGRLTARAMIERGLRPVLAGRRRRALDELADGLGGLEVAVADVERPESVRALVGAGDVLVTTVGPFARWGRPALDAALDAQADYVDAAGESVFVREAFERGRRAERSLVLPASGYDSVPGNLAASLALREAGPSAASVRVGYFVTGARRGGLLGGLDHMSEGSRATMTAMALEPSFAWRGGRLVSERASARVGVFDVGGERRRGVSFGTSEALSLPRLHPHLRDVEVSFGWFGSASRLLQAGSLAMSWVARVPGARATLDALTGRLLRSSTAGPADESTGSLIVAQAAGTSGDVLATVSLQGINGYAFTGRMLAWVAQQVAEGSALAAAGALGPVEAFGAERLEAGVAECGMTR